MVNLHGSIRDSLPVRLGNRKYNIDIARLARATVDPIREGFDTQGNPGEQSLNQAGVWKRSRNDWELGAGQREADTMESGNREFFESFGVNPWVKNEITLLKDVGLASIGGVNTNLHLTALGDYLYMTIGTRVDRWKFGVGWETIQDDTGSADLTLTAATNNDIATDGTNIYVADGGTNIYRIQGSQVTGTGDGNVWTNTDTWDGVYVAHGYVLATCGPQINWLTTSAYATAYNVTNASFDKVDSWTSICSFSGGIYSAGNKGDQGRIFFSTLNDSTQKISSPVPAAELPVGEKVRELCAYAGLILIGTNKGIRLAQTQGQGFLQYGPLITTSSTGVNHFDPQGEFVYFDWTNYDGSYTGLGRLSLEELTGPLTPAYATDIMYAGQGEVQGVITVNGYQYFTVSGAGICYTTNDYVASGTVNEGRFRWGITELKAPVSTEMRHSALLAGESIALALTSDDGTTVTNTSNTTSSVTSGIQAVSGLSGEYINPVVTITRGTDATKTPTLYRWTSRAIPMPFVAEVIQLPVILSTQVLYENNNIYHDTWDDYTYIRSLLEDRSLVTFTMGDESKTVYVAGVSYERGDINTWTDDDGWFEGVLTVSVVTVQGS